MQISDFNFILPVNLIANEPASPRDSSKLLVLNRQTGQIEHRVFYDLPKFLIPGDVLVFNQTKVLPVRLYGQKTTGGKVEVLLLKQISSRSWKVISKPGLKKNQEIVFSLELKAKVLDVLLDGESVIEFDIPSSQFHKLLTKLGHMPLPPYINSKSSEAKLRQKYQTVYAKEIGSAAAPTAGFHFTRRLLNRLKNRGVQFEFITLHVGLGTFKPVAEEHLKTGKLHSEEYFLDSETAKRLNKAKKEGRRIIAVGTTSMRVLETCAKQLQPSAYHLVPNNSQTDIFIYPPYKFKFVDGLITNFHLPKSSLLMLVSAFTSSPNTDQKFTNFADSLLGQAYQEAIKSSYRVYSFGDASLIY